MSVRTGRIICNHHRASSREQMAPSPSRSGVKTLFSSGGVHNCPLLIETPCCEGLYPVLLESHLPGPKISAHKPLPRTFASWLSISELSALQPQPKVYIPPISRYLDARIAQHQWLKENESSAWRRSGPGADVSYLIRYLFLETPSQRYWRC